MSLLDDLGLVSVTPSMIPTAQLEGAVLKNPSYNSNGRFYSSASLQYTFNNAWMYKHEPKRMFNIKAKYPYLVYGFSTQQNDTESDYWETEQEAIMVALERHVNHWVAMAEKHKNNAQRRNGYMREVDKAKEDKETYFEENAEYFI